MMTNKNSTRFFTC